MKKLCVGSGQQKNRGTWICVDCCDFGDNIVHDLNKYPWPFKDNSFVEIEAKGVLEHLNEPEKAINEILRVATNGAKVMIKVPNARYPEYCFIDPQHRRPFSVMSLNYWIEGTPQYKDFGFSHHQGGPRIKMIDIVEDYYEKRYKKRTIPCGNIIFTFMVEKKNKLQ